jgi:hypothetical protein
MVPIIPERRSIFQFSFILIYFDSLVKHPSLFGGGEGEGRHRKNSLKIVKKPTTCLF